MKYTRELWAVTEFRRLLLARFISNFGNGLAPVALAFGVLDLPGATATDLSKVMAAQAVALVIFLPFGGVWADRLGRASVISITDMILALFIATIGMLFVTGLATIPILMALNFVAGMLNALWWPAFPGLTPEVVRGQHLQSANGLIQMNANMALIIGAGSAGLLVEFFGAGVAIIVDACTFALAGLLVYSIRHVSKPHSGEYQSMVIELRDGWKVFTSYRWVVVIVAAFSIIVMMTRAAEVVLGPVLMKEQFNGPLSWATVTSVMSIGMLVGALVGSRIKPKRPMVVAMVSVLAASAWMFAMAVPTNLFWIAVGGALWGFCIDLFGVFWFTALQTHVPKESFSRVASYDAFGSMLLGPVGVALAGPVVAVIGLQKTFLIGAIVVAVIVLLTLLDPAVRQVRWKDATTTFIPDPQDPTATPLGATGHQS